MLAIECDSFALRAIHAYLKRNGVFRGVGFIHVPPLQAHAFPQNAVCFHAIEISCFFQKIALGQH